MVKLSIKEFLYEKSLADAPTSIHSNQFCSIRIQNRTQLLKFLFPSNNITYHNI